MERLRIMRHLVLILFAFECMPHNCQAFSPSKQSSLFLPSIRHARNPLILRMSNNDNEDEESLDDLLDKPFFNPEEYDENDISSPLGWFANLVKSDYELAETLYVGTIFVVSLVVAQELLRMQIYDGNYTPFTKGGVIGGRLF
jgi:hypothetical protein